MPPTAAKLIRCTAPMVARNNRRNSSTRLWVARFNVASSKPSLTLTLVPKQRVVDHIKLRRGNESGVVLSHPGSPPFVQQTARALYEANLLSKYVTRFSYQP